MISELTAYFNMYSQPKFIFSGKNVYELFRLPSDILNKLNEFYRIKFQWKSTHLKKQYSNEQIHDYGQI